MQMSAFGIEIPTIPTKSRSRSRNSGLNFEISGFGIGIWNWNLRFRDSGSGFGIEISNFGIRDRDLGLKSQISGFGIGIRDWNFKFRDRDSGLKFQISGFGIRIRDLVWDIRDSGSGCGIELEKFGIRDRDAGLVTNNFGIGTGSGSRMPTSAHMRLSGTDGLKAHWSLIYLLKNFNPFLMSAGNCIIWWAYEENLFLQQQPTDLEAQVRLSVLFDQNWSRDTKPSGGWAQLPSWNGANERSAQTLAGFSLRKICEKDPKSILWTFNHFPNCQSFNGHFWASVLEAP